MSDGGIKISKKTFMTFVDWYLQLQSNRLNELGVKEDQCQD